VPAALDKVYMARARRGDATHYTQPFQLTAERGAVVAMPVYPGIDLRFHLTGSLDDRFMTFDGTFSVSHGSFVPHDPGPEGLAIPLPRGFAGAKVPDHLARDLKVVRGRGLVWTGVISPGLTEFRAAFTMPVRDGAFTFDMDLPHGAVNSDVSIARTRGMEVRVGGGLVAEPYRRRGGLFMVVDPIDLPPGQRLVMQVTGLPHQPRWRRYARIAVGLLVLALLGTALFAVVLLRQRPSAGESAHTRREELLDALAELERRKRAGTIAGARYHRSRKKLMDALRPLYARRTAGASQDTA
jgi:hypothetical protein